MTPPLIPSSEFVTRVNEQRDGPPLTALDPLMMLIWHTVSRPPEPSGPLFLVTGT